MPISLYPVPALGRTQRNIIRNLVLCRQIVGINSGWLGLIEGKFGSLVSLQGNRIVAVPMAEAVAELKTVDSELYDIAKIFFG